MREFSARPSEMFATMWRHRHLIYTSAKREVVGRYRGSVLGLVWSFFNPILMLAVYTFVFSEVFNARWSAGSTSKTEFALVLFAGLIIFNLFSECANRAPALMLMNQNYVKRVVFPLEVLPVVGLLAALYHTAVSLAVWIGAYVVIYGVPHATILLLPLIFVPFCLFIMGVSWLLASLGVFLRDVTQFIGIITMVLLFMSPIFYPASAVPEYYRPFLYINPLTSIIELARELLFWGRVPNATLLGVWWLVAPLVAWLGFVWFQKTRKGFADVL